MAPLSKYKVYRIVNVVTKLIIINTKKMVLNAWMDGCSNSFKDCLQPSTEIKQAIFTLQEMAVFNSLYG